MEQRVERAAFSRIGIQNASIPLGVPFFYSGSAQCKFRFMLLSALIDGMIPDETASRVAWWLPLKYNRAPGFVDSDPE